MLSNKGVETADQWERGLATWQPITTLLIFLCGRPDPYSFFWSTGPEVISKFPSHSSLAALLSHQPGSGLNCEIVELRDERRDGRGPAPAPPPAPATLSCSGNRELGNNIRHRNPRPRQTTKMIPWTFQFCLNKLCSCEARIYNLQSTWDVRCAAAKLKSSCQLGKPQIKKEKYKDRISWQAGPGRAVQQAWIWKLLCGRLYFVHEGHRNFAILHVKMIFSAVYFVSKSLCRFMFHTTKLRNVGIRLRSAKYPRPSPRSRPPMLI